MNNVRILGVMVIFTIFAVGCIEVKVTDDDGKVTTACVTSANGVDYYHMCNLPPPCPMEGGVTRQVEGEMPATAALTYQCPGDPQPCQPIGIEPGTGTVGSEGQIANAARSQRICPQPGKQLSAISYFYDGGFSTEQDLADVLVILPGTLLEEIDLDLAIKENTLGAPEIADDYIVRDNMVSMTGVIRQRIKGDNAVCTYTITDLQVGDQLGDRISGLDIEEDGPICAMAQYIPGEADYWPVGFTELTLTDLAGDSSTGRYGCWNSPRVIDRSGFNTAMKELVKDIVARGESMTAVEVRCVVPNN